MKDKIVAFSKFLDKITFKLNELSGLLIAAIVVFILIEIVTRKVFNCSFYFVLEVTTYMLATSWFLAAPFTLRTDGHIRIDIISTIIKGKHFFRYVDIIANIIGIIICYFVFLAVFRLSSDSFFLRKTSFSPLRAPLYISQLFIAIGTLLMLIQMITRLLLLVNEKPDIDMKSLK